MFSFVQKIENITFPEAVRLVAQKLGIALPKATYSSPAEAKETKLRARLLDIQERAAAFFQECLKRPEEQELERSARARLDEETIARFRIGYAPISASCCATAWQTNSAKTRCGRAACFPGRRCPVLVRPFFGRTGRGL